MRTDTKRITTGALFIAIFGMLLLIDRQTGFMLEGIILYLLPIPMVAYTAKYGVRTAAPVLIAMGLISVLVGDATSIFYAISQALIGLIFGGCIYRKLDLTKTLFLVMIASVAAQVADLTVISALYGVTLTDQAGEMKALMTEAFTAAGTVDASVLEQLLTPSYLKQILIIAAAAAGALEGFIVFEVSLLVMRRLKLTTLRPRSVFLFYPPVWTGGLAVVCILGYLTAASYGADEQLLNALQGLCITAAFYLEIFAFLAVMLLSRAFLGANNPVGGIIAAVCLFTLTQIMVPLGALYICGGMHSSLLARCGIAEPDDREPEEPEPDLDRLPGPEEDRDTD